MLQVFATPRNRTLTIVLLATCCACVLGAAVVGISDNPPGIILAYLAATAFVVGWVHPWRTARQYLRLLVAAVVGFVLFAILHNVFEAVATSSATAGLPRDLMQIVAVVMFLVALLVCPPAALVGLVGPVVLFIRSRRRPDA